MLAVSSLSNLARTTITNQPWLASRILLKHHWKSFDTSQYRVCFSNTAYRRSSIYLWRYKILTAGGVVKSNTNVINRLPPRCSLHTTPHRYNPIISTIARQVVKVATIFIGRAIRNWWKKLPPPEKRNVLGWFLRHKWKFIIPLFLVALGELYYYYTHLQETPITGRIRFIAFTPEQFELINKLELETQLQQYNSKLLPNSHKSTKLVAQVAKQLLDKNNDIELIKAHEWTVSVVDDENTMNAFVLPSGSIFVFTGLLKICENTDQLGIVLAHEISHAILSHGIEMISHAHIVDMFFIGLIGLLWMILPTDFIAALGTAISRFILRIMLDTPYSKMLETEADEVGLRLAAKACFDIREASAFWYKMSVIQREVLGGIESVSPINIEFLTTHPSHEKRCEHLNVLLDKELKCRSDSGCGPLPKLDPRERTKAMHNAIVETFQKKKHDGVLRIGDL